MVRFYIRPQGARTYADYANEKLGEALQKIKAGQLSQRQAALTYNIPRSTLKYKLKGLHSKSVGKPPCLTADEENAFVGHLIILGQYGFPFSTVDLRCLVKYHLDQNKRKVKEFKDNLPGESWAQLFLKRNKILTSRTAANIKRSRAKVSPESIEKYFDCLEKELQDVESENIWNYDETNLVDDPGRKKVLVKRGTKYPERLMNSSKSANSVMFCGNGMGELLPPYVVYKAENMWNSWTQGGWPHSRYNRSKSGWFDHHSFEDWFFSLALPRMKKQEGRKVLLGDNLSSHLSLRVIQACNQHNISFIALPPNSTHLTQPLDVAFFRPLKAAWRSILLNWKTTRGDKPVSKDVFPRLLKEMLARIGMKNNQSLQAGFKKCGISPVDRSKVLERIPKNVTCSEENNASTPEVSSASNQVTPVSDAVLQFLSESRYGSNKNTDTPKNTGKSKVNVVPGKSISENEVNDQMKRRRKPQKQKRNKSRDVVSDSEDKENVTPKQKPKKRRVKDCSDSEPDDPEVINDDEISSDSEDEFENNLEYEIGSYVIVEYEEEYFPGQVVNADVDGSAEVKVMVMRGLNDWGWPEKVDQVWYDKDKIIEKINEPALKPSMSSKAHRLLYSVPEIIKYRER
ncbi:Jerky protein homolog-like [Frankliniella fusca]|uniref:Jerky protein homolog-like n=1 Tax=Frankliniella fusca TaxID=407009 RepID=A0AAE1IY02_9NEOP|nr:Jerky protein homolog-like [Frankliniella fusca]